MDLDPFPLVRPPHPRRATLFCRVDRVSMAHLLRDLGDTARSVIKRMEQRGGGTNIVILDACRNNPLPDRHRSAAGTRGLTRMEAPLGSVVLYAASEGQAARDDEAGGCKPRNGLFTAALLRLISQPGLRLEDIFYGVVKQVSAASGNEQQPMAELKLTEPFYFQAATGPGPASGPAATSTGNTVGVSPGVAHADPEEEFWLAVKDSHDAADFADYLRRYPDGRYADAAQHRIKNLGSAGNVAIPQTRASGATETPGPGSGGSSNGGIFSDCDVCPVMVPIPAGRFEMGSPSLEASHESVEGPLHTVTVSRFALGRNAVTKEEFSRFVDATGYETEAERNVDSPGCTAWSGSKWQYYVGRSWRNTGFPGGNDHPVLCLSWNDAQAYVRWLSRRTGHAYRLPTEAEWEYAARAGTTTSRYWGENTDDACKYANVADLMAKTQVPMATDWLVHNCSDGYAYTAPVRSFRPNAWGLYDMLGNAWQWTQDCYHENYVGAPTDASAWVTPDCKGRVLRGGSWNFGPPPAVRSAYRTWVGPKDRGDGIGMRVARSLP